MRTMKAMRYCWNKIPRLVRDVQWVLVKAVRGECDKWGRRTATTDRPNR